jgi:hypothetical protein
MKKIKFWRMEIQQLSVTERIIFNTAINKLLSWEVFKKEFLEIDLIRRLLESEIQIHPPEARVTKNTLLGKLKKYRSEHTPSASGIY